MAIRDKDAAADFRGLARSMFFSNEVIDAFLAEATVAQVRCVSDLISHEGEVRERNKRARLYRRAKFPQVKSFDGYDFSRVTFPDGYTADDLRSLAFVDSAQDFVFHGQTGRGKTHLAIAVGTACVAAGRSVRFFTAAELALALSRSAREHRLEPFMKDLARCDLLILDEFGYVPIDIGSARLLFQVVSACYESRSVIFTTNIEFSKWGTVLGDEKLAAAMIDRVVHHGRLVEFGGPSRRMDEALMLGKGGGMMMRDEFAAAAERSSGKTRPINELPAFYTNHWDVCELCGAFTCVECVAAPEDIGLGDYEPCDSVGEEAAWEIPF